MTSISKNTIYNMFQNARLFIQQEYEYINKLNVFPVPDGDTGSNMMTTLSGALEEIKSIEEYSLYEFTKKFSRSLLMNAHGNSGVILSQILKGFFQPINEDTRVIDINLLIDAFHFANIAAYKVVDKPKEGTMLTVIRMISEHLESKRNEYTTIEEVFTDVIFSGNEAVEKTPDLLPVLKKANVVDSGGYGLMIIFKGMYDAITTKSNKNKVINTNVEKIKNNYEKVGINSDFISESEEGYGYCCEFIIEINASLNEDQETKKQEFTKEDIIKELNEIGNSLVIVNDDIFCKVHIHALNPYKVLQIGQKYGEFHKVKVDNMTLQKNKNNGLEKLNNKNNIEKNKLDTEAKVVATVPNEKIGKLLSSDFDVLGIIDRSNNQNPSVKDFIDLIRMANSNKVIIVIDNKDCYLAASQAISEVAKEYKIQAAVINCSDILQSLISILSFNKFTDFSETIKVMNKSIKKFTSIKIAKAAKNTYSKKLKIQKDDYILLKNKDIILNEKDLYNLVIKSINYVISNKKHNKNDCLYLIVSDNIDDSIVEKIKEYINSQKYEFEIINSGNDVYLMYIGE